MGLVARSISRLDAYPKLNDDFQTKTRVGGVITIVSSIIMTVLFVNELRLFLRTSTVHELGVDTGRGEVLDIQVDVTFPRMPCSWLSLDTMDVSGELHLDVMHEIYKQRLSQTGAPLQEAEKHDVHSTKKSNDTALAVPQCGSCYGAETVRGQCCNTCDEVREAYRKKGWGLVMAGFVEQCKDDHYLETIEQQKGEGCRMFGHLQVNKVAGNFHFAPGRSYQQGNMHVHDIAPFGTNAHLDFSHTVHHLSFGKTYPGMKNPLDGAQAQQPFESATSPEHGMFQYFLKIVPTKYASLKDRDVIPTNQYSVTTNYRQGDRLLPGLFFFYEPSPIKVHITETRSSFLHFLTSVCAIVGGVFTVAGIIDAAFFAGERLIKQKLQIGKLS
ncbi:endoplasmic reticulum vesicle transporter-domain-containing protein [Dunaliella salina]|uniref:Endoplasmic reticulum vesicle transporter-domain-containing protein n=1 Tax=Dunaliella salina TaxID=3046 RepID=A0ABQ7GSV6_DUNSA|nr:endoplasmic reticulum vesicle transporter-domain-containing protein [Dunaliella salina]|eukprot:KAF5837666.1 endoplasmic reticulum vesicle transporter-domain-containing protein [Dunaliella salina]